MKLTKSQLKQIIKEELEKALNENIEINSRAQQTWKNVYESVLEDMDDVYMWLNEIGSSFNDFTRYSDDLELEGVKDLLDTNNIQLPITDLEIAVKLYQMAKAATQQ